MDFVKVLWRLVKGNNDCLEEKKTVEYRVRECLKETEMHKMNDMRKKHLI